MPSPPHRPALAPCPEEALFVDLIRTADALARGPAQLLKQHGLSSALYNVLRILRGARPGLLCGEIAARMVTREPDITRLIDRLEARGLVHRCREDSDRRRVLVRIAPAGLALLAALDPPIRDLHRRQLGHLTPKQWQQLVLLLEAARRKVA